MTELSPLKIPIHWGRASKLSPIQHDCPIHIHEPTKVQSPRIGATMSCANWSSNMRK